MKRVEALREPGAHSPIGRMQGEEIMKSTIIAAVLATMTLAVPPSVLAASADPIKIGVLTDMSGVVSDATGKGSVEAARIAVEEAGGSVLGHPIEVIYGDHQHKPDVRSEEHTSETQSLMRLSYAGLCL